MAPSEPSSEATEDSPLTDTWEFRAMAAEAVIAALVEAVPRIIAAAVTGHPS
jgi:hypothetical protein